MDTIHVRVGVGLPFSTKYVDRTPDKCPVCHHGIIPIDWNTAYVGDDNSVERLLQCPNDMCRLAQYTSRDHTSALRFQRCVPTELLTPTQPEAIKNLSVDFCSIFGEAYKAEQYGLLLVAGPGYRKAFEFLIKDYAKASNPPECKAEIEKMPLGDCIIKYIEDERIKQIARRATWLANDEVHYVRKWENKDLKDVKALIQLTLHWIEMVHLTKQVLTDMPAPGKANS
jgi:hypothetical protein